MPAATTSVRGGGRCAGGRRWQPVTGNARRGTICADHLGSERREDKTVIAGVEARLAASKDGGKVVYRAAESFGIVDGAHP